MSSASRASWIATVPLAQHRPYFDPWYFANALANLHSIGPSKDHRFYRVMFATSLTSAALCIGQVGHFTVLPRTGLPPLIASFAMDPLLPSARDERPRTTLNAGR